MGNVINVGKNGINEELSQYQLADGRWQVYVKPYTEEVKEELEGHRMSKRVAENIEVTDAQVDAEVAKMAENAKKTAEEYKKDMDPRQLDYIKNDVLMTNLIDFLKANNTFEKKAKATTKKTEKVEE
jgi:trigger factor